MFKIQLDYIKIMKKLNISNKLNIQYLIFIKPYAYNKNLQKTKKKKHISAINY